MRQVRLTILIFCMSMLGGFIQGCSKKAAGPSYNALYSEYLSILKSQKPNLSSTMRMPHLTKDHFVTAYAMRNAKEDFAETYTEYATSSIKLWSKAIAHWEATDCTILLEKVCFVENEFIENNVLYFYTHKAAFKLPSRLDRGIFRETVLLSGQGLSTEQIEASIEKEYAQYIFLMRPTSESPP